MKPNIQDIHQHYRSVLEMSDKQAVCCNPNYPKDEMPKEIAVHSFSVLEPVLKADIQPGQTILDIGCGAGADCFLAARRTREEGKVIGIEIVDSLMDRANLLKAKYGFGNVTFQKSQPLPLPFCGDNFDVILLNYAFHLFPDKLKLLAEIQRCLKVGSRAIIADSFKQKAIDYETDKLNWFGRAAGAISFDAFSRMSEAAGFHNTSFVREVGNGIPEEEIVGYAICEK